ncbi:hypothetical protein K443DRAFT_683433 [Laccaria amethystina LaAM-08-1]|uniref:Uncharacterized protein n=1 Tax=Laccaria amethystina LaAM-08-1 TaxID=1095629 RepID=A0A0C9X0N8_9AGAR|nr:hypothetical protein K443DRAFT_683433 [Laccaria amethystina LaAM-08-1]
MWRTERPPKARYNASQSRFSFTCVMPGSAPPSPVIQNHFEGFDYTKPLTTIQVHNQKQMGFKNGGI